ncbi:hypothetical protein B566_EDAN004974, partial [Ephemera danica]
IVHRVETTWNHIVLYIKCKFTVCRAFFVLFYKEKPWHVSYWLFCASLRRHMHKPKLNGTGQTDRTWPEVTLGSGELVAPHSTGEMDAGQEESQEMDHGTWRKFRSMSRIVL